MNRKPWQRAARDGSVRRRQATAAVRRAAVEAWVRAGLVNARDIVTRFELSGYVVHVETVRRDLRTLGVPPQAQGRRTGGVA